MDAETVAGRIHSSSHLVVFTGAGVSTASGLPDYRGPEGVWTLRDKGLKPKPVSKPWNQFEPNAAHYALVDLQEMGYLKHLISQNVENLHLKSGILPQNISELHGNSTIWKCLDSDHRFSGDQLGWDVKKLGRGYRTKKPHPEQPDCPSCGSRLINSVVNFNDPMPDLEMEVARNHARQADLFLVIGSSLAVNPAASFPRMARKNGAELVIINMGRTEADHLADLRIDADCSVFLPEVISHLRSHSVS
ncbi:MAG: SIR2 family NAD-dependent protein deacylase [Candidatus Kariarchaeaceae archaeon]|jgi:mono-ADP-ribosyltransferase sirtuin 6